MSVSSFVKESTLMTRHHWESFFTKLSLIIIDYISRHWLISIYSGNRHVRYNINKHNIMWTKAFFFISITVKTEIPIEFLYDIDRSKINLNDFRCRQRLIKNSFKTISIVLSDFE